MARPCIGVVVISSSAAVVIFLTILLSTSPLSYSRCLGGVRVWGDQNYSNDTMTLNVSEVTAELPLCEESSPNRTSNVGCQNKMHTHSINQ